ncbi:MULTISPECIES: TetR/AcrR family transcriptional regulator [Microbacterium]|uniref:TetR/AcrR family transcriptional regulator n=1 Tax=Microbacterium TaxID=33882 RepID=UPI0004938FFF|nr:MULTISPECIES: TetR/AcrR family transcriptional regulator [Microbacterium]MCV0335854.1 TetR/AcrR family transcriptional regulator [Microbacterium sp.]MCV0376766.1 TetR/AcrR family transcriptional regulator [Microbacterium sp.]MCV0391515.1 TetR/AcrR family transcriptional regulator [Microbacterium sp.]MCV0419984.1 TetR/AcrR family transcriptional regulator [Microbacterium sp.]MCV0423708.1 TetR/AcrR family transcriptional regulator [Microbacterium sp.]
MTEDEARERILSTAEELYYRKGYAAVGMDELRQEAGVSLRRLYSLFPSKTDIVVAVLARKHAEWESGLSGAVADAGGDPRARLLAVYGYLENWFCADDFRGCAFINAFGELGGTNPEVAEIVRAHKASFQEYMAGLVAQTGASPALAAQLSILAEGAQSTAAISADPAVAAQARGAAEVLIDAAFTRA